MRSISLLMVLAFATVGHAQTKSYRTLWGDPDLQGIWNNQTLVPLERPPALAEKPFFTEKEAAEFERTYPELLGALLAAELPLSGEADEVWQEKENGKVGRSRRTSLVIDPPDGKVPYTPEGRKQWDALPTLERFLLGKPFAANGPEDRTLAERCVAFPATPLLPNPFYNNNHHIFQTREYVAILNEENHNFRIIPLDGRPHVNIPQWNGTSRGWWQGYTLMVETRNFNERRDFFGFGATAALRLVESFTRVDDNTINYQVTMTDPATFTQPWTVENVLRKAQGLIYEYACHEGNYGLVGILAGARAEERR